MEYVFLLTLHFIADFILQPREMGRKKSTDFDYWRWHVLIQFSVFFVGLVMWTKDPILALTIAGLNAFVHGAVDACTWRLYAWSVWKRRSKKGLPITRGELKKTFKYWEDHWFYVTIGFDQWLHISTIVVLWEMFK